MNYTPRSIYEAMGQKWWCDDDFSYPLDPNLRYSTYSITTMQREWDWRTQTRACCIEQCVSNGLRIPKQRANLFARNTPQLLEIALFRAREEENRMRLRLHRHSFLQDAKLFDDDGDMQQARLYRNIGHSPEYDSDNYMSDDG